MLLDATFADPWELGGDAASDQDRGGPYRRCCLRDDHSIGADRRLAVARQGSSSGQRTSLIRSRLNARRHPAPARLPLEALRLVPVRRVSGTEATELVMQLISKLSEAFIIGVTIAISLQLWRRFNWWWRATAIGHARKRRGTAAGLGRSNRLFPARSCSWRLESERQRLAGLVLFGQWQQAKYDVSKLDWPKLKTRQIMSIALLGEALNAHECNTPERLSAVRDQIEQLPVVRWLGPIDEFRQEPRLFVEVLECLSNGTKSTRLARDLRRLGRQDGGLVREFLFVAANVVDETNPAVR